MTRIPRRLALVVGVSDPPTGGGYDEPAASVNDARAIAQLLSTVLSPDRFGLDDVVTTTLYGEAATKLALLDAMAMIKASCSKADQVVFYFSGHGWLSPEVGETTLRDTALAPYGAKHRKDLIADEVLYRWIQQVSRRTSNVHLIIDSCYAGGFEHSDMPQVAGARRSLPRSNVKSPRLGAPWDRAYALMASSRFSLRSATGYFSTLHKEHSAFTGCLIELLRSWNEHDDLPTYTELSVLLEARMRRLEFAQQPQVAGDVDRVLLGKAGMHRPSRRLARVRSPNELEEGAAHGVAVGSRWIVLQPLAETEDPIRHLSDPMATVQVVKVGDFTSEFAVVEPPGAAQVEDDSLALEVARPGAGTQRLVVGVAAEAQPKSAAAKRFSAIAQRLSSSPVLDVRTGRNDAEVDVRLVRDRGRLRLVVHAAGARSYPLDREFLEAELSHDLEEMARAKWTRAASQQIGGSLDTTKPVRIGLWRKPAAGNGYSFVRQRTRPAQYAAGDELAVRVTNTSDRELFLTLFHVGSDDSVVRLHPTTGQNAGIEPGRHLDWGFGSTQTWIVGRPAWSYGKAAGNPRHWLVVWATTEETDLRNLCTAPATHRLGPLDTSQGIVKPYWRGLDTVAAPAPTAPPTPPTAESAWFAVRRDYIVITTP